MLRYRDIRQIQKILFIHRLYAYLLALRYIQFLTKLQEETETKIVSFGYDPFGRRIWKSVEEQEDGKTETKIYDYVYDNEDIILEYLTKTEDGETKTETTRYIHGLGIDEPLAIEKKGEVYYYHTDGLGSIVALTDKRQKVVQSYTYDSFGDFKKQGDKVKDFYTFTGRIWDDDIRLYEYRNRLFDPAIGRFITYDPSLYLRGSTEIPYLLPTLLDKPQELNPYVYTLNNPVNLSDPKGLFLPPFTPDLIYKIWCAYNEYLNGKNIKSSNDKYKHCVTSCKIGKNCGIDISILTGYAKEIKDLLDMDPNTFAEFEDIVANVDGIICCFSSLTCEKCCECERGHKP
jgi:RHS repeat-associated protein